MSQAIISRRGGGYATVKFENYGDEQTVEKGTSTNLVVIRTAPAATTLGNYALLGSGTATGYYTKIDVYGIENLVLQATVYKGSKYKFQNMAAESTVTSNVQTINIPTPAAVKMTFEQIKKNFERRLWDKQMVVKAVEKGVITTEQYEEITGEKLV